MGAPKQKWTNEEESALRAGVEKYGPGKWRAILKDPVLCNRLASRSNVDLKDKWRNMSVTANGWGSREKARLALKRSKHLAKQSGKHQYLSALTNGNVDNLIMDARPLATVNPAMQNQNIKGSTTRLEKFILDAVSSLKEPNGSNKFSIAKYIEESYCVLPNFKKLLSSKLRSLSLSGRLVKVRQNYKLGGNASLAIDVARSAGKGNGSTVITTESPKEGEEILAKFQAHKSRSPESRKMSAEEAAKVAAIAVVEAEVAIAAAKQAAHDAEAAEAEAVAAELFAEAAKAAMMALTSPRSCG